MKIPGRILSIIVLALWVALVPGSYAGIGITPGLLDARKDDQLRQAKHDAEISLKQKLEVGKKRYEQRQAVRNSIIESMRAQMEERRAEISGSSVLPASAPAATGPLDATAIILAATILILAFLAFRHLRKSRYAES
jgi:hypothetical protein